MGRRKRRNPDAIPRTSDSAPSDSDLPGYVFDPVTKRHFRVPINSPFSTAYLPDTVKKLYQKPAESSCSDANQVRNSLRK